MFTPQGRCARFEELVKKPDGSQGYIDALWPGSLLVEQKSRGRDLDAACHQALDYLPGLPAPALPGYVLVSDFTRLRLHDLDQGLQHDSALIELPEYRHLFSFGFLTGYRPACPGPRPPGPRPGRGLLLPSAGVQLGAGAAGVSLWPLPAAERAGWGRA